MNKGEKTTQNAEGTKPKKKRKKKALKIIIPIGIVLVIVLIATAVFGGGNQGIPVYTDKAFVGDISTELSTSGIVKAEKTKTFFAPANVTVEGVNVVKGDIVKAGDMMICFDEEAVAYAKRQSELSSEISSANYNSNVQYNNEQRSKLEQANAEIAECEAAIDNYQIYIDDLTNGITDMTALRKSDLYAKIYSVQKEMNSYELAIQTPNENTDMEALLAKKTEKQNELNKLQNELNMLSDYKTSYGWEYLLTQAKKELADYETRLSEAKSQKASAEAAVVNGSKLTNYALNKEKEQLTSEAAGNKYDAALTGIVS